MVFSGGDIAADFSVTARRSYSLSPCGLLSCFLFLALVSWSIAIAFALHGAWLIMPFAGLEIAVLAWAFLHVARHSGDCERISICGSRLTVERVDGQRVRRTEFNRHWARVLLETDTQGGACRVALRAHGREVEVGSFVGRAERLELAQRLKASLGQI